MQCIGMFDNQKRNDDHILLYIRPLNRTWFTKVAFMLIGGIWLGTDGFDPANSRTKTCCLTNAPLTSIQHQ